VGTKYFPCVQTIILKYFYVVILVEAAGGKALPCVVDIREEKTVVKAIEDAVKLFGGIDILVNNASAISLTPTLKTDMKRFDLMHGINTRGTYLVCVQIKLNYKFY